MDLMQEKLTKLREERLAREKARIEKLRELNLKKYSSNDIKSSKEHLSKNPKNSERKIKVEKNVTLKENTQKRPSTVPASRKSIYQGISNQMPKFIVSEDKVKINTKNQEPNKPVMNVKTTVSCKEVAKNIEKSSTQVKKTQNNNSRKSIFPAPKSNVSTKSVNAPKSDIQTHKSSIPAPSHKSILPIPSQNGITPASKTDVRVPRKSMAAPKSKLPTPRKSMLEPKSTLQESRKSIMPVSAGLNSRKSIAPKVSTTTESVFDRLYKPKSVKEHRQSNVEKVQTSAKFCEKLLKDSALIMNNRHTMFEKPAQQKEIRRSISAVHFKRIAKSELGNCNFKWASTDNLNKVHLKEIEEDNSVKEEKVISAIKSDRKKVTFRKSYTNFNTPKPEELQERLKSWLEKRGKNVHSYHHLQCFGLHHLAKSKFESFDDENKENIAVDSDSDNDSFSENMNEDKKDKKDENKWRRASAVTELDETINSEEVVMHDADELVIEALNDLTDLLREGYDWEQSARWLRAIRERFPAVLDTAAYWECRAALEERQGNFPETLECWEEAYFKGTDKSVLEANLDHLLDKFMQLKLSPNSAKKAINPKMVDVKNVFKSTLLQFAVKHAKMRQSNQHEYIVTPVRRSNRLSVRQTPCSLAKTQRNIRTPLVQICSSMKHIDSSIAGKTVFIPNDKLPQTP